MARRKETAHGGHGWFVTFADLMGLLVSFFVMLVAFSTQDQAKLQVVAGSMRDAFGVQDHVRYSGIVEVNGLPTRPKLKNAAQIDPLEASATPTPDEHDRQRSQGARIKQDKDFALASASLRQALQDLPDITEVSKHILMEDTKEGLNIEIVDQDGRSMFADGSKEPDPRTRALLEKMAPALRAMPYRLSIVGHTAAHPRLRPLGPLRRPCQRRAGDSGRRGRRCEPYLHGGRQGRHGALVPRQSVACPQPAGDHYHDAGSAPPPGRFPALIGLTIHPRPGE
jgi:chemotaxis protein MotB